MLNHGSTRVRLPSKGGHSVLGASRRDHDEREVGRVRYALLEVSARFWRVDDEQRRHGPLLRKLRQVAGDGPQRDALVPGVSENRLEVVGVLQGVDLPPCALLVCLQTLRLGSAAYTELGLVARVEVAPLGDVDLGGARRQGKAEDALLAVGVVVEAHAAPAATAVEVSPLAGRNSGRLQGIEREVSIETLVERDASRRVGHASRRVGHARRSEAEQNSCRRGTCSSWTSSTIGPLRSPP